MQLAYPRGENKAHAGIKLYWCIGPYTRPAQVKGTSELQCKYEATGQNKNKTIVIVL
jgi:hypothetical protein